MRVCRREAALVLAKHEAGDLAVPVVDKRARLPRGAKKKEENEVFHFCSRAGIDEFIRLTGLGWRSAALF